MGDTWTLLSSSWPKEEPRLPSMDNKLLLVQLEDVAGAKKLITDIQPGFSVL